ncbi:hypothetical protein ABIB25_003216 [Nakamurella sp. UYEF19]|uniref:hypothetical protein n=1 Tax=Nakamurella sp. UYEF19 TaxID=1756392 RepID=UPI003394EBA4
MSLITDIRAVSENAVEQIAARFSDLPRPLLAAIGAGDMAIERLADLRESFAGSVGEHVSVPSVDAGDLRSAVGDFPARAQKVASEVAGSVEKFAAEAPAKAQEFIAQLPEKLAEVQTAAQSLSPDAAKETIEAYTQLAGMIYGSLADRGGKRWSKVRAAGIRPGVVIDAAAAKVRPVKATTTSSTRPNAGPVATATATRPFNPRTAPSASAPTKAAPTNAAPRAATKAATTKVRAPRTPRVPAAKVVPPNVTIANVPAANSPRTTRVSAKPATPRSAAKPATPKSTAKPATPRATAGPATPKSAAAEPIAES